MENVIVMNYAYLKQEHKNTVVLKKVTKSKRKLFLLYLNRVSICKTDTACSVVQPKAMKTACSGWTAARHYHIFAPRHKRA